MAVSVSVDDKLNSQVANSVVPLLDHGTSVHHISPTLLRVQNALPADLPGIFDPLDTVEMKLKALLLNSTVIPLFFGARLAAVVPVDAVAIANIIQDARDVGELFVQPQMKSESNSQISLI